jgi:hypothetical protein
MTEEEVTSIINKICNRLAKKFVFGYYDRDDIYQQAFIFGIEGLENYDDGRPLENFLWVHIKNRLCTFKRDQYERLDSPCVNCKFDEYDEDEDQCLKHDGVNKENLSPSQKHALRSNCKFYKNWLGRNNSKKNLLAPIEFTQVKGDKEKYLRSNCGVDDIVGNQEILDIIDKHLPSALRSDYLKMLSGASIPKPRRVKVQELIHQLLLDSGYDDDSRITG